MSRYVSFSLIVVFCAVVIIATVPMAQAQGQAVQITTGLSVVPSVQAAPANSKLCFTFAGVKARLEDRGYHQLNFISPLDAPILHVRARNTNHAFLLKVDACTAEVLAARKEYIGK